MSMGFELQGVRAIDDPSWQAPAGKDSPVAGKPSPHAGTKTRIRTVPADWLKHLADYLRAQHPVKTADAVAARCRGMISAEQVRKWLALRAAPNGVALLWLATCYGPGLIARLFGPSPIAEGRWDWIDIASQAERVEDLGARLVALRAELDAEIDRSRP